MLERQPSASLMLKARYADEFDEDADAVYVFPLDTKTLDVISVGNAVVGGLLLLTNKLPETVPPLLGNKLLLE